jgi:hypothetical protein
MLSLLVQKREMRIARPHAGEKAAEASSYAQATSETSSSSPWPRHNDASRKSSHSSGKRVRRQQQTLAQALTGNQGDGTVSIGPLNLATAILAVMLSTASGGAIAATRGTQTGGAQSTSGTTKVQPNLQQCQGPTHNCGKPGGLKCQMVKVQRCRHTCTYVMQKQCSN